MINKPNELFVIYRDIDSLLPYSNNARTHSREHDLTGVFCTSGSERESTLEGSWYADEEIQAGAHRNAAAAD